MDYSKPDLTEHPPRSGRAKLGGYVILPRIIDKCRALLVGKNGDFNYGCPLDNYFFRFTGIEPDDLKAKIAEGASDSEVLQWVQTNAPNKPGELEIRSWTQWMENRVPGNLQYRKKFTSVHEEFGPEREDIFNTFDLLDLDDYVSFGGNP